MPTYTVSFDGGGASGQGPTDLENVPAGAVLILPDAGALTKNGFRFAGWLWNGTVYQSGDSCSMPAWDVTFVAQWQAVHTVSGTVQNTDEEPLEAVTVTLMLGAEIVDTSITDNGGTFSFSNVPGGIYNLVAQYKGITSTSKIDLANADSAGNIITMPEGMTNSIVTVVGDTPVAVVGNLNTVFAEAQEESDAIYTTQDVETVKNGGIVEIEFVATTPDTTRQEAIQETLQASSQIRQNATVELFLDLSVEKTVTTTNAESSSVAIDDTGVLLEIYLTLPAELQGKDNYVVYRIHDGAVQTLAAGTSGERIAVNGEKTALTIYARYYSDYAVAWWDNPSTSLPQRPTYRPEVAVQGSGQVSVSPTSPTQGQRVTILTMPEEGYVVGTVTVTTSDGKTVVVTKNGDGTYSFTQPGSKVTVSVTFRLAEGQCPQDETCPIWPFTDASTTAWYHDGIHYALENGLMTGTGAHTFSPNTTITRAMLTTILWRLEGSPEADRETVFRDVAASAYYDQAVRWAAGAGVVTGYEDGTFVPNRAITREEMAAMLYRYAQYKGYDVSVGENTNILSYSDAFHISEYAVSAMQWACGVGIINGNGDGSTLDPRGEATRAQAAVILMRFCNLNE